MLNQSIIKEGVKNIAGSLTFVFGILEAYDVYSKGTFIPFSTERFSHILSASMTRPGIYIISSAVGCIFSAASLESVFGPNTIFAINPLHPRHVASFVPVLLTLPSIYHSTCEGVNWAWKKIFDDQNTTKEVTPPQQIKNERIITDTYVRPITIFNFITSRPVLHIANHFLR